MTVRPAPQAPLRIGVAGLGRAFTIMLPTFRHDTRVQLVAAADPSAIARARFSSDFGAPAHASVADLCADPQVQVVYVATPHQLHREHVALAAAAGKHVLVEKPMAITLQECQAMVDACAQAGVHMLVGHSHSFDAPILRLRALVGSGQFGRVRMIHAMNYTDFLYRPRRPEELDTRAGGGVVFTGNHCPVAIAYEERFKEFAKEYGAKGVSFVAINVNDNASDNLEANKQRAEEQGFNFPYAYDATQQSAKAFGATFHVHIHQVVIFCGAVTVAHTIIAR